MDKEIIPSISLINGKPVVVKNERYEPYMVNGEELDLWDILGQLKGYDKVHLLDIDGIEFNKPQTDAIRKVSSRREVWADVGARDPEGVTDSFIAGANRTIISTKTIRSKKSIMGSVELSDQLILSIDYKEGVISPSKNIRNMGVNGIAEFALDQGVDKIIFSSLSNERFEERNIRSLPHGDFDLFVGGATLNRAKYIKHENLKGFILSLREAIKYQRS